MYASQNRTLVVTLLVLVSCVLSRSARHTRNWANALGSWIERRRSRRIAVQQLSGMSDRELWDIGLTRSDIEWVASRPNSVREPLFDDWISAEMHDHSSARPRISSGQWASNNAPPTTRSATSDLPRG